MTPSTCVRTALLALALAAPGCISIHETVEKSEARRPVEFENDKAASLFYERLSQSTSGNRRESTTRFSIPVVLDVSSERKTSSDAAFNRAVALCDTNQDGRITEQEARIFSERR